MSHDKKQDNAPQHESEAAGELSDQELDGVAGGFNPQPDPPQSLGDNLQLSNKYITDEQYLSVRRRR